MNIATSTGAAPTAPPTPSSHERVLRLAAASLPPGAFCVRTSPLSRLAREFKAIKLYYLHDEKTFKDIEAWLCCFEGS